MCTVTFIPTNEGIIITSNRDEHISRGKAIAPIKISSDGVDIIYPKDPDAGGTWIATKNNGDTIVLLNGAFKKHIPKPPYAKSRGLILLSIFELLNFEKSIEQFDLMNIEPFTIVYYTHKRLFEFRWDGQLKYLQELSVHESYIWSSVTLYDVTMNTKRKEWFEKWHLTCPNPNQEQVINFHLTAGDGDSAEDLKMNRQNELFTVSISTIFISKAYNDFVYFDLYTNQNTKIRMPHIKKQVSTYS